MKKIKVSVLPRLLLILAVSLCACSSGGGEPLSPADDGVISSNAAASEDNHTLWGLWDISIDYATLTATAEPLRAEQAHFDVTQNLLPPACNNCVGVGINSFNPGTHILSLKVTLRNPYGISGRDVRGILYTNDAGHRLVNADSWTGLFDIAGGGTVNPFKAFAKGEANRVFAGFAQHMENFQIYVPNPPQWEAIKFAVDASWPGNCKEPYSIENFTQETLYDTADGQALITVDAHDWQNDVNKVTLAAPEITGASFMQLYKISGDTWGLNIKNNALASAGVHSIRIIATSTNSGTTPLYHYVDLVITAWGIPANPVDITPQYLNFCPQDVCVDGDIAYVAGSQNGIHSFDISDPANPVWVSSVGTYAFAYDVVVDGNYAYVADEYSLLEIYEIVSPGELTLVKSVSTPGEPKSLVVANGYAVIADGTAGVTIVDVDPIATAYVVGTIDTPGRAIGVAVSEGYVYVADYQNGMQIIDIDPIGSAGIVKNVIFTEACQNVIYANGYVYAAIWGSALAIVDVDPVVSTYLEKYVYVAAPMDLVESNGYVYMACGRYLRVIDVDPPITAAITGSLAFRGFAVGLALKDGNAFIANAESGLDIIDVSNVSLPQPVTTAFTLGNPFDLDSNGDYLFVGNWLGGFNIVDTHDPYNAEIIKVIDLPTYARSCKVRSGYAYVSASNSLEIIDIDPPESAAVVKSVADVSEMDIALDGGYAYVAASSKGLMIVDIEPINSAYILTTVDTPGNARGVAIEGDYAYVADETGGLQVIDINPPGSASVVHAVATTGDALRVAVSGNYAYVAEYNTGVDIVDISSPLSASVVKTVDTPGNSMEIAVCGSYAYVADGYSFTIIDIDPVDSAYIYLSITPLGGADEIDIYGNIAYLGHPVNEYGGVRFIKLW